MYRKVSRKNKPREKKRAPKGAPFTKNYLTTAILELAVSPPLVTSLTKYTPAS